MIDIHTHILFGIDDGSESLEISLRQLKIMSEAGVEKVVLTPHYIRNSYHNTREVIDEKLQILKQAVKDEDIPIELYPAAEVYLEKDIIKDIEKENFNINNSRYVLVETSLSQFPPDLLQILYQLVVKGFKPILAHPERYSNIANDFRIAEDLINRNVYMQVNAGSILGNYGKHIKKAALNLLEYGYAHFLASDNHCKSDDYILPKAVEKITEKYDGYLAELLTEINPQKVLDNENIPYFYLERKTEIIKEKSLLEKIFSLFK